MRVGLFIFLWLLCLTLTSRRFTPVLYSTQLTSQRFTVTVGIILSSPRLRPRGYILCPVFSFFLFTGTLHDFKIPKRDWNGRFSPHDKARISRLKRCEATSVQEKKKRKTEKWQERESAKLGDANRLVDKSSRSTYDSRQKKERNVFIFVLSNTDVIKC